jgi:hypothetical protein
VLHKLLFWQFSVLRKLHHQIRQYYLFFMSFPIHFIPHVHLYQLWLIVKRSNQQLLLCLHTWQQVTLHILWVSVQKYVCLPFVINLQIFYLILSFVPDKQLNAQNRPKLIHFLVNCLWLKSNLDLIVFKKRIFVLETTGYEPSVSLIFCDLSHRPFKISAHGYLFSLVSFVLRVQVWRIEENLCDSTFGDRFTEGQYTTFFGSTDASPTWKTLIFGQGL